MSLLLLGVGRAVGGSPSIEEDDMQPQGRLTLTTAVPVTATDVTAATSIFYALYKGAKVPLSGTLTTFTELTLALDSTSGHTGYHQSGKNFDLFAYSDSGTIRLCSGPAWTNDTTRADAISYDVNGVLVNTSSIVLRFGSASGNTVTASAGTATYLGTFRASADGQTESSLAKRFLWNSHNRVRREMRVFEAADNWNWSTASWQQRNNSTANQLAFVRGLNEDTVSAIVNGYVSTTSAARIARISIGLDSTTVIATGATVGANTVTTAGQAPSASYLGLPGLGYHFLAYLEQGAGADTQQWSGDAGAPTNFMTGIIGDLWG